MITKSGLLLLLLVMVSCGAREVKFPDNPQAVSPYHVTKPEQMILQQEGVFLKHSTLNGSTITTGGQSYPFSEYSSNQALTWYSSKPVGSSHRIAFRGEVKKGKLVLEIIQDK